MKKAVMYGAGNIGRGFIGQLFSESGYEVVFIEVNNEILNKLNDDRQYPVRILSKEDSREVVVTNVRGVNGRDIHSVAEEIAGADIMATAVGVNILPRIAGPIAQGLRNRWKIGKKAPLNIIICENLLNANIYLAGLVKQELDDNEKELFDDSVGMVESSIGRMVPVMTGEMQNGNVLRICVEEYGELPVDKEGFKGKIPVIKNMLAVSPFEFYIQRKLFIHNMGHAVTAYLGRIKNHTYIWESIEDTDIRAVTKKAMYASAEALSREHGIDLNTIMSYADDLIQRFGNRQLADTISRVGNDIVRKLSYNDRLVGAARLCIEHGVNPIYICMGIAAALKFNKEDCQDEIHQIINSEGVEAVLKKVCGLTEKSPLWNTILCIYLLVSNNTKLADIIGGQGDICEK